MLSLPLPLPLHPSSELTQSGLFLPMHTDSFCLEYLCLSLPWGFLWPCERLLNQVQAQLGRWEVNASGASLSLAGNEGAAGAIG